MARKSKRRRQATKQDANSQWLILMLAGLVLVGLAAGLVFIYGRSPSPSVAVSGARQAEAQTAGAQPVSAVQAAQPGDQRADLPPLSTEGHPIAGWHDMANIPKNFEGHPLPEGQPQPDVVVEPANRDLGSVGAKDVVNVDYIVVNQGDQDLVIDNVVTSCGCTTAVLSHNIIPPGHRADLAVRFDAGYHEIKPGEEVVRVVWLLTNDPDTPVAEARLTATIR
jgi:hypothetical protein